MNGCDLCVGSGFVPDRESPTGMAPCPVCGPDDFPPDDAPPGAVPVGRLDVWAVGGEGEAEAGAVALYTGLAPVDLPQAVRDADEHARIGQLTVIDFTTGRPIPCREVRVNDGRGLVFHRAKVAA